MSHKIILKDCTRTFGELGDKHLYQTVYPLQAGTEVLLGKVCIRSFDGKRELAMQILRGHGHRFLILKDLKPMMPRRKKPIPSSPHTSRS